MVKIFAAKTDKELELVRALLEEYVDWMVSEELISEQELGAFKEQLVNLPNGFAPPNGCLLVGMYRGEAAGCVALRDLSDGICEMKRLFVTPEFRGLGIGRALAEAVIGKARKIGYSQMRVHTLRAMETANLLYSAMGFKEIGPYEENIIEGAVFMELKLV
ncbi:MAG: GNAT family N-acetyltransferase [Planctomycetota bacterium]|nr:MAG: GNAT family N-acetyltransferase [Planctomycetota bacterium]